MRKKKRE